MVEMWYLWIAHNLADKERTTLVVRSNDMLGALVLPKRIEIESKNGNFLQACYMISRIIINIELIPIGNVSMAR